MGIGKHLSILGGAKCAAMCVQLLWVGLRACGGALAIMGRGGACVFV